MNAVHQQPPSSTPADPAVLGHYQPAGRVVIGEHQYYLLPEISRSALPLPAKLPISLVPPAAITFTGIGSFGKKTAHAASIIFASVTPSTHRVGLGVARARLRRLSEFTLDLL